MEGISQESDLQKLRSGSQGGSSRKSDDNAAFYSGSSGSGKRGGGGGSRSRVKCHNCDKIGHFKADCWAPGGGKEGKGPRGKGKEKEKEKEKDTAASARSKDTADAAWMALSALTDSDSEFEELTYSSDSDAISFEDFLDPVELLLDTSIAPENPEDPWADMPDLYSVEISDDEDEDELEAHEADEDSDSDSDDDELPDLQPLSDYDSDSDDDEYGDMPGLMDAEESDAEGDEGTGGGCNESEESDDCEDMYMEDSLPYDTEAYTSTFNAAALSKGGIGNSLVDTNIVDSGASRHMSGSKH